MFKKEGSHSCVELPDILLRHPQPRKFQDLLIEDIRLALQEGRHLIAHAPTGIGKTDAVFSAALPFALKEGKKLIYLSPKISQHEMALKVLRGIKNKYGIRIKAIEIVGKQHMCIHPLVSRLRGEDFYEVCRKLKEVEECPFYVKALEGEIPPLLDIKDHFSLIEEGRTKGLCPHEMAILFLSEANVVIGDYYHIFSPRVGRIVLKKLKKSLSDVILIIDEAHNLPERIRKVLSVSLRISWIEKAAEEARSIDIDTAERIKEIYIHMKEWAEGFREGETPLDVDDVENIIGDSEELGEELVEMGREYIEATSKTKAFLLRVGKFFLNWKGDEPGYLRYLRKRGNVVSIVKKNLDPSIFSGPLFEELHSAILVSGTLTPPEMYRDVLGLPANRTILREYPSPFPKENRLVIIYPLVTTRYSKRTESEYKRIGEKVGEIAESVPGNVMAFYPSFDILEKTRPFIKTSKTILVQREKMKPEELAELLETFRSLRDKGALLLAVAGGSLSEGVDYPGRDLIGAIIVGIPLAEMNIEIKALIDYYDEKYGRGWLYGYIYPALAKVLQAMGRVIRSETDRGVIVLMDERYTWKNYMKAFPRDFSAIKTSNPVFYIKEFFAKNGM